MSFDRLRRYRPVGLTTAAYESDIDSQQRAMPNGACHWFVRGSRSLCDGALREGRCRRRDAPEMSASSAPKPSQTALRRDWWNALGVSGIAPRARRDHSAFFAIRFPRRWAPEILLSVHGTYTSASRPSLHILGSIPHRRCICPIVSFMPDTSRYSARRRSRTR